MSTSLVKIFILLSLISFGSFATDQSLLPKYCTSYPSYIDGKKINPNISPEESQRIGHTQCVNNLQVNLNIAELTSMINRVEKRTVDRLADDLRKDLAYQAVKKVLNKKTDYFGVSAGLNYEGSEELRKCGKYHKQKKITNVISGFAGIKSVKVNKKKQKDFMALNIINALKAAALFKENENYYDLMALAKKAMSTGQNRCEMNSRICRKGHKSKCREIEKKCIEKNQGVYSRTSAAVKKKVTPLLDMVSTNPLLFDNADEGNWLAAFTSDKLKPSPLLRKINTMLPLKNKIEVQNLLAKKDDEGLKKYFANHTEIISNIVENEKKYKKIQEETDDELKREFTRLDDAALALCEGEGEKLHHYPMLAQAALNERYKNEKTRDGLKYEVAGGQAAYCHLLRNQPLEEDGISAGMIGGFALLGIGVALQFIPVAGTIAGTGFVGMGMALTGGAVLTGVGINDTMNAHRNLNQEIGLHSVGLSGYNKLLETKDYADFQLYWSAADVVLLPLDLHALRAYKMKSVKGVEEPKTSQQVKEITEDRRVKSGKSVENENRFGPRRYNFDERNRVDDLGKSLGGKEKVYKNFDIYFPKNKFDLNKRDIIYVSAIADLLEKDFLKTMKKPITKKQKRVMKRKNQKVLDNIAKKCRQEAKK